MNFAPPQYEMVSVKTGTRRPDSQGWTLGFTDEAPSLIRADYQAKQLHLRHDLEGIYRFADWLPIRRILTGSSAPISYRSKALASELNLSNLWITFNGWWPEKSAAMHTGTFKECEAYSVCARMDDGFQKILVVASAGNTARAFARVCSDNRIPLLLFVPKDNLDALWFDRPVADCVHLVSPASGGDYFDAIRMSEAAISGSNRFIAEGGAKNIARRDGMGTTVLSTATAMGRIPDAYFQAVGSGTGAIAAWEAAMRLKADGRFGSNTMRLIISQNAPFTPLAESWEADSRELIIDDDETSRRLISQVNAKVLTNRRPPWGIPGGLYDALKATNGTVIRVTNEEAALAGKRFAELEGCDITCAAQVALASLFKAVETSIIKKHDAIMLNITGGGKEKIAASRTFHYLNPTMELALDTPSEEITRVCESLFSD